MGVRDFKTETSKFIKYANVRGHFCRTWYSLRGNKIQDNVLTRRFQNFLSVIFHMEI